MWANLSKDGHFEPAMSYVRGSFPIDDHAEWTLVPSVAQPVRKSALSQLGVECNMTGNPSLCKLGAQARVLGYAVPRVNGSAQDQASAMIGWADPTAATDMWVRNSRGSRGSRPPLLPHGGVLR